MINLHGHSEYSSLDGFCKVSEIPLRAKELNQSAIALTDHGNLNGIYKFYKACKKNDIKPILGEEFYLCDDVSKKNFIYHITLLAKNYDGWKNLLSLHKISFQNIYYKPRIDLKSLKEHSQGLICLSGCLRGMLPQAILKSSIPEESLGYFTSVFKDDFYVEIMNHGLKDQQRVNSVLRELCDKYKLKKVVTNDYHYLRQEDHELQDILLCDQIKSTLDDPKRLKLSTPEFYIKSQEDLINIEQDEIDNTELIAGQCKVTLKKHDFLIPESEDAQDIFVSQITQGIKDRFGELPENYTQRLRTEYEVITKANLIPYFLIVSDYVNWAKSKGILVGTGRGSVGGCLIAYLLNIHDLDPIKHNLLFSRFYNPGRKNSLPDIDVDFPLKHIDSIINYLISKYGKDNVANIGTYTSLDIKGAIKLLCRTMGIDFETSNKFSKYLDSPEETKLECAKNSLFKDLYEKAQSFLNLIMYSSIHAAGIVISSKSLDSMIPIRFVGDRQVSSWTMDDIEEIGLVKYDILHLNTLDIIEDVLLSQRLKIKDIPLDDKQTFDLINYTNNVGIFQLSSMGISSLANQMKVESIDDISLVVALYRPGPISSNFHNIYINRKFNREPVTYLHPKLEPILKSTLGVLIYQEQIIAICQQLGGFSEIEADSVRKAMGKKIPELMKKYEKLFIEGCDKNQIDKGIAQKIWNHMDEFAGYGFNKCIDGDCYISRDNNEGSQYTISEMYDLKNNPKKYLKTKQESIADKYTKYGYGKARNLINDKIYVDGIKNIYYQGKKPVFKITLKNGNNITVTENHKFPTLEGIKLTNELKINKDYLYCNINGNYQKSNNTGRFSLSGEQNVRKHYSNYKPGFPEGQENPGYIDGEYTKYRKICESLANIKYCQLCNKTNCKLEHHHKDKNRNNNSPQNIIKLCLSCHKKEDYKLGRAKKFSKGLNTELSLITKIEYIGEKDVYDIEMENEPHNLFVNNIATCNSHSTAYAYITYYTSYLKSHYPVEFMTSLLNNNFGNQEKLSLYLKECKRLKIEVIPPSVNGNCDFSIKDDKIIFGLKGVKGMGEKTGLEIVKQKYSTFTEFCIKVRPSSDIIVTLAEAGAFDEFDLNRNLFIDSALDISQQIKNIPKESIKVRTLFKIEHKIILKDKDELDFYDLAEREYNRLGVYLRYNPLETKDISDFTPERLSNYIAIGGFLHTIEEKITKKGQKMGIGKFMTELGEMEVIFFPKTYLEKRNLIRPNNFLNLQGKYDINNCKLCVEKIGQIL